jgi:hypothetical protein
VVFLSPIQGITPLALTRIKVIATNARRISIFFTVLTAMENILLLKINVSKCTIFLEIKQ